ncbi:MAG: OmpA family protein [Planctomycetes bacterium]|nr:OmpA family protein [Planctomycetota bacterium]
MRCGGRVTTLVVSSAVLIGASGCASIANHRRVKAQNRTLAAEKEQLQQDLFDLRGANESLRGRVGLLEQELAAKDELVVNLRGENQVLDDMRRLMQGELESLANQRNLSPIQITGPRLPAPLDNALKQFAAEHPSLVDYDSAHGTVKWKSDLLFALGSDVVNQTSMESLQSFTDIIKSPAAAAFEVVVVGHTDNRPISRPATKQQHPTNWHLSAHRAISVSSVLRQDGYPAGNIGVMGYGEYRPVADNGSDTGASQNRRVEIYLIPKGAIVPATASAGWEVPGESLAFARLAD